MNKSNNSFENYPDWLIKKWQEITNILADILLIPSALIMKTENEMMEVFISSKSKNNPYHVGDKEKWDGLYCETVIKTQEKLLIPNATRNPHWDKNPDIKLGMIAYLGFPIKFPDNQPFGTICILDNKENQFTSNHERLLLQFKNVLELDLALLQSFNLKSTEQAKTIKEQQEQLLNKNVVLKKALKIAEENDKLKTTFLQNVSHEIRTPMNAIMGFSGLLVENYNNKSKLERFSEIIQTRCADLLTIINDILEISRIESGQLSISKEQCNVRELFKDLNEFFIVYKNRIGKQNVEFEYTIEADSEIILITDKIKLKQILTNLISNAFKFTQVGKINIGCKVEGDYLMFSVSDTGVGIPENQQNRVFSRFVQVESNSQNKFTGTGLGLSIVKGLVEILGGEIMLNSTPNIGSTFFVKIPYKKTTLKKNKAKQDEHAFDLNLNDKTILIVEDDIYNAEYLKEILSDYCLNIISVSLGQEAVDITLSQSVDLILLDIRLPDMSGYDAMIQIKKHKPNIKIICQTAFASQEDKQQAFYAGCDDYISKPIKRDLLLSMVKENMV